MVGSNLLETLTAEVHLTSLWVNRAELHSFFDQLSNLNVDLVRKGIRDRADHGAEMLLEGMDH